MLKSQFFAIFMVWCLFALVHCQNNTSDTNGYLSNNFTTKPTVRIYGLTPYIQEMAFEDNTIVITSFTSVKMRFYGHDLNLVKKLTFSTFSPKNNHSRVHENHCKKHIEETFELKSDSSGAYWATVKLPPLQTNQKAFYLCSFDTFLKRYIYEGDDVNGVAVISRLNEEYDMPIWLEAVLCSLLFGLSGLFSGLNLGLMSLNPTDLKLLEKCGSPRERHFARHIYPVRRHGNFLLCTLLLGNVLVNSILAIFMEKLTGSGTVAVITTTLGITMFGEIIPQAVCSRYGLAIGSYTIWVTKIFMVVTSPLSYPISLILDRILGEEISMDYSRDKLRELIAEQGKSGHMDDDEVNIITGALSLTTKTVREVMTPLRDVYMISYHAILDFDTLNEIVRHGFTRIPIYENEHNNIRAVLNVKDLAFVDPDAKTPVATVCKFYKRPILIVDESENLDRMLKVFRTGKTHMAFVEHLTQLLEGDPRREIVGLVTLEDVIEEIIQAEIVDETDTVIDNVGRDPREVSNQDFSFFLNQNQHELARLSPQVKIATLRHLTCDVNSFKDDLVDVTVLSKVLNADILVKRKLRNTPEENELYTRGQCSTYAILLLQGHAAVEVTDEKLLFETGAFTLFGEKMLQNINRVLESLPIAEWKNVRQSDLTPFFPDYTVRATSDLEYVAISALQYLFIRRQSALMRLRKQELTKSCSIDDNPSCPAAAAPTSEPTQDSPLLAIQPAGPSATPLDHTCAKINRKISGLVVDQEGFLKAWWQQGAQDSTSPYHRRGRFPTEQQDDSIGNRSARQEPLMSTTIEEDPNS